MWHLVARLHDRREFPMLGYLLEGLPMMEVSPSLVGGRLVVEDVYLGELTRSRRRCRTSKGEDALIALGEDAEVVVVVALSWWCSSRGLLFCS